MDELKDEGCGGEFSRIGPAVLDVTDGDEGDDGTGGNPSCIPVVDINDCSFQETSICICVSPNR